MAAAAAAARCHTASLASWGDGGGGGGGGKAKCPSPEPRHWSITFVVRQTPGKSSHGHNLMECALHTQSTHLLHRSLSEGRKCVYGKHFCHSPGFQAIFSHLSAVFGPLSVIWCGYFLFVYFYYFGVRTDPSRFLPGPQEHLYTTFVHCLIMCTSGVQTLGAAKVLQPLGHNYTVST